MKGSCGQIGPDHSYRACGRYTAGLVSQPRFYTASHLRAKFSFSSVNPCTQPGGMGFTVSMVVIIIARLDVLWRVLRSETFVTYMVDQLLTSAFPSNVKIQLSPSDERVAKDSIGFVAYPCEVPSKVCSRYALKQLRK